jgi:nitrous oxide reductase accessory protein NosL
MLVLVVILLGNSSFAATSKPVKPGAKDKCPVCGMFVAKYPDFVAQIHFRNGTVAHFDGAKDLLKYYQQISRFNPKFKLKDISAIFVTDYYLLTPVDAYSATYVYDSDVYGPMGKELIPFAKSKDAQGFLKDHKGKGSLTFKEVTPAILKGLD